MHWIHLSNKPKKKNDFNLPISLDKMDAFDVQKHLQPLDWHEDWHIVV